MWMAARFLAVCILLVMQAGASSAAPRVALVIGNGNYEGAAPLDNPVNDATDIAAKLRELGFEVVEGQDLGKREMEQKIGEFSDRLEGAEAAVLYYAGHGIAVAGRNFVVPVDAHLDAPAKLKFESISVDDIAELMRAQAPVSILILDACRNNPFGRGPAVATRGASEGSTVAAQSYAGSYTVYAAQDGAVALDGKERNSPFAAALLKRIATPGASVETVMGLVKADVEEGTRGFQSPDAKGLLTRSFSFAPEAVQATRAIAPPAAEDGTPGLAEQAVIRRFIESEYLDPDVVNLEATLARVYVDEVNVFGTFANQKELYLLKKGFFDQFEKWELSLFPGTLEISFSAKDRARVVFVLKYVYWPKADPGTPAEGNFKAALGMVKHEGRWKIESEAAVP